MATLIIAEVGVNHNGDIDLAKRLVEAASEAGADAVKFQTFKADDLVTAGAPKADYQIQNDGIGSQIDMLKSLELTVSEYRELAEHCKAWSIKFLSTAFGVNELSFLLELGITAIKVPSGEITNLSLLEAIAEASIERNLPVYLSTGMSTLEEVEAALGVLFRRGVPKGNITVLHCVSAYPAPEDQINLSAIGTLERAFGCPVGYSDHTLGITASIAAVALGAVIIEKHITLDTNMPGPDHRASLVPEEFQSMVEAIRSCERMLGDGVKRPQRSEDSTKNVARRSIRAAKPIKKGALITIEDLAFKRPGDGVSPMKYKEFLGTPASIDYEVGDAIH